ncbi:D-alanyl-D-alanine carboxypeptidase family protein [Demequina sp. SYSU T00192]|uniref:D-alanyl-D-alanine carboxypeptidase family protein n=1 Tax=Demequina litoralis TaxID=3051660 RepID=A0ABT8G5H8_9MICO|nr:D-alanyl-D-alanine carboxypeptidase family protein [Demequina sp. SYSU T00192]MDN4474388.1 D-alanyl-D-alanine carboxypeptidase family protein [Demequina sp. SYSU T00192]
MRKFHLPFRWQTATTFAVCCFLGGIAVALGVHEQRVGSAVEEARAQARLLDDERMKLELTLEKAREVSQVSESVSDEDLVASAAAELAQAATSAAYAAEQHNIVVSATAVVPPVWANAPLGVETARGPFASTPSLEVDVAAVLGEAEEASATDATLDDAAEQTEASASSTDDASAEPSAEPSTSPSASPTTDASASASPSAEPSASPDAEPSTDAAVTEDDAEALAALIDDTEVAQVLRGEVDDLETVAATVTRLEEAAAQLDAATRRIEGTTAVLEAATADAALERANLSLEEKLDAVKAIADSAKDMVEAVDGNVQKRSVITDLNEARRALLDLRKVDVDRDDAEAVEALVADVQAATADVEQAEQALYTSHRRWVKAENQRRTAINKKRMAAYERQVEKAYANSWSKYAQAAANHQDGWSGAPTGISYSNGQVPASQLCSLSFASGHQLQCDAAEALERADDDYYAQTGNHLSVSSSYRSYSAQVATKASKGYLAATPGTSNHGWGMAADFAPASATWMRANGEKYGWVHPLWARSGGSKPESWHLEFVAPGIDVDMPDKPTLLKRVKSSLQG